MKWNSVKLGEAFWFQEGPGVRNWQFTTSGIKLLNISNILKSGVLNLDKTDKHLSIEEATGKYAHFLADAGDLVMASSGVTWGKTAFIQSNHLPLCLNTSTIRFKAKDQVSSLQYLRHWIHSDGFRGQMTKLVTGSAQPNFGPSHLKLIEIPLPPLAEQERIASLLDAADRLRAQRRDALKRLDALTHSLFLDTFGDPAHNPKKWPVVKLGGIMDSVQTGFASGADLADGVVQVRMNNITKDGRMIWDKIRRVPCSAAQLKKLQLVPSDIMFNSTNSPALVGKSALFSGYDEPVVFSNHFLRLRVNSTSVHHQFVAIWLVREFSQGIFEGLCTRWVNQASVRREDLLDLEIPLPPLSLQQEFATRLEQIETLRARMERSALELDALFASLQNAAFAGE